MESPIIAYLKQVHTEIAGMREGAVYPFAPVQAGIDPNDFGIALATVDGHMYRVGTTNKHFSIQSISKPLTYGLALNDLGTEPVDAVVDVEPSGYPYNEISLGRRTGRPPNAMINAGALAVVSLIKGSGGRSALQRISDAYSALAGRQLAEGRRAYRAEQRNSDWNHALTYLLRAADIIDKPPPQVLETYLRQCTIQATCTDLARIAATLANGGTNPLTGAQALSAEAVQRVLSVMMTCGMYDDTGDWANTVGMPAKSGVGGGIIAVLPGQAGLAVYSPPVDEHGNSVRGVAACRRISRDMDMHFVRAARTGRSAIRSRYTIDREPSKIRRTREAAEVLAEHSYRGVVIELTGDLYFAGTETMVREVSSLSDEVKFIILDVRRLDELGHVALEMLTAIVDRLAATTRRLLLVDPEGAISLSFPTIRTLDSLDSAVAACENQLLLRYGPPESRLASVAIADSPVLGLLSDEDASTLVGLMHSRTYEDGDVIRRIGQRFGGVFFILSGQTSTIGTDPDGRRIPLSTLGAGMMFGDLTLGSEDRQETTVKADGRVEAMVLEATTIESLEQDRPELAIQLWRALARDAYVSANRYAHTVATRTRQ